MSRTYRFLKSTINNYQFIGTWLLYDYKNGNYINPYSKEAKKRIAMFFSDKKPNTMRLKGPGWYHNLSSQRPYRREAKYQLKMFLKSNQDFDVILESKPHRHWWY